MTASVPEVTARLDEIDRLRAAALIEVAACWSDGADMAWVECNDAPDAALIVAAVSALPELVAAVRAVLDLADDWGRPVSPDGGCALIGGGIASYDLYVTLAAALAGRADHTGQGSTGAAT